MYFDLEYLYNIFNNYKFILFNKQLDKDKLKLEFCRRDNMIDKFSIIFQQNLIETIIPLKLNNKSFKTKSYDFNSTINYLIFHIENYSYNKYI